MKMFLKPGWTWDEESQSPMPTLMKRAKDQERRQQQRMAQYVIEHFATPRDLLSCLKNYGWPPSLKSSAAIKKTPEKISECRTIFTTQTEGERANDRRRTEKRQCDLRFAQRIEARGPMFSRLKGSSISATLCN